jgi:phosphatidate cytidylyltransferase
MNLFAVDSNLARLFLIVLGLLVTGSIIGFILARTVKEEAARAAVFNMNTRIVTWWVLCAIFALALLGGVVGVILLFALLSFLALREFITIAPTHPADHRTLFWAFFLFTPFQYYLVAVRWYGMYSILIPVYAFLYIPMRNALAGDTKAFLERTAKIQWGLMVCTYCLSYAPALLVLDIPGFAQHNAGLLFYFLIVVQLSDVMQYVWGKLLGRTPVAPEVSPNKTLEGLIGGVITASLAGTALCWATPFKWWQAAPICLITTLVGFAGDLTMSAIKRERGVKDYGTIIVGHGGVLDRIDSICFAAPVFFHTTRYFFTP